MPFTIKIKLDDTSSNADWEKSFDNIKDFQAISKHCGKKFRNLSALFYAIRTTGVGDFAKDFFVPWLSSYLGSNAIKTDNIVKNAFKILALLSCDILTLPIRIFTLIPRLIYNVIHSKERNPLYKSIASTQDVNRAILAKETFFVQLEWEKEFNGQVYCYVKQQLVSFRTLPDSYQYDTRDFNASILKADYSNVPNHNWGGPFKF